MSDDYLPLDTDGDGVGDGAYYDLNDDGVVDTIGVDSDGDGMLDTAYVDTDQDSEVDAVVVDTDGDGILDTPLTGDEAAGYPPDDGGQSFTPPDEVSDSDVRQASEDLSAQSSINSGMNATYTAMNAQYGMDLS